MNSRNNNRKYIIMDKRLYFLYTVKIVIISLLILYFTIVANDVYIRQGDMDLAGNTEKKKISITLNII